MQEGKIRAGWRAALCGIACALALIAASPATAQVDQEVAASRKTAAQVFWRFTQCVVRREPRASAELLRSIYWSESDNETAARVATRNNSCALLAGDRLTMQPPLFRSALASAAFVARHDKQPLPDYSLAPQRFGNAAIAAASAPGQRGRAILLNFAECVFRQRSEDVRNLLAIEPMSAPEAKAWAPLNDVLGGCLPATPGSQVRFTRMALRGLLGEAAYELDQVLAVAPPASPAAAP